MLSFDGFDSSTCPSCDVAVALSVMFTKKVPADARHWIPVSLITTPVVPTSTPDTVVVSEMENDPSGRSSRRTCSPGWKGGPNVEMTGKKEKNKKQPRKQPKKQPRKQTKTKTKTKGKTGR